MPIDKNDPRYSALKDLIRDVVGELVTESQSDKQKQKKKPPVKKEENIFDALYNSFDDGEDD